PDRLGQVPPDLLGVHVERRDEFHVTNVVGAELHVHQARYPALRGGVLVVLDPLDEGTSAVTHTHDGYPYRTHEDCSCSFASGAAGGGAGLSARGSARCRVVVSRRWRGAPLRLAARLPLRGDQLVEPADLPLNRLEAVPVQFQRVTVQALPGPRHRRPDAVQALLQPSPAAFQDAQPDVRAGQPEEGERDADPLVSPRGGAGLGQQLLQPFLALRGEPVHDLRPAARQWAAGRVGLLLRDQALRQQLLEAWVERAVTKGTEGTEERVQPLAQFVAVHGGLVQQAEHGQLDHSRRVPTAHATPPPPVAPPPPRPCWPDWRCYTSNRCIEPIHRQDMSRRAMSQPRGWRPRSRGACAVRGDPGGQAAAP